MAEFTDDDVDLFIAYDEVERDIGPYGISMSEATSPDADPNGGHIRYIPHSTVNHALAAVERAQDEAQKARGDAKAYGVQWWVERKEFPRSTPPTG